MGAWWIEAAIQGLVPQLPLINKKTPEELEKDKKELEDLKPPKSLKIVQGHYTVEDPLFGENNHEWSVRLSDSSCKYVKEVNLHVFSFTKYIKVTWILHPTFRNPTVTLTDPPFKLVRRGWGTFTVKCKITLIPQFNSRELQGECYLNFSSEGDDVEIIKVDFNQN